jgi:hypothetical protein
VPALLLSDLPDIPMPSMRLLDSANPVFEERVADVRAFDPLAAPPRDSEFSPR